MTAALVFVMWHKGYGISYDFFGSGSASLGRGKP